MSISAGPGKKPFQEVSYEPGGCPYAEPFLTGRAEFNDVETDDLAAFDDAVEHVERFVPLPSSRLGRSDARHNGGIEKIHVDCEVDPGGHPCEERGEQLWPPVEETTGEAGDAFALHVGRLLAGIGPDTQGEQGNPPVLRKAPHDTGVIVAGAPVTRPQVGVSVQLYDTQVVMSPFHGAGVLSAEENREQAFVGQTRRGFADSPQEGPRPGEGPLGQAEDP